MKIYSTIGIAVIVGLVACHNNQSAESKQPAAGSDTVEIRTMMANMYKWHNQRDTIVDFQVLVKDSFQVGIDSQVTNKNLEELMKTDFFTPAFLNTYRTIGRKADYMLKHGKYYNEINFTFQDADSWNFFQDDVGSYWDSLKVTDFRISGDKASLKWHMPQDTGISYEVRFRKLNNLWKIEYMQGFDTNTFGE